MERTKLSPMCLQALSYARRGWPVFPVKRDKAPVTRDGFKSATLDEPQIVKWWRFLPFNIGFHPGPAGLFVLDVDPRNGGDETLARLESEHGALPRTVESLTGGGGRHLFFRAPAPVRCGVFAPGVDVKGSGGYVILPPSRTEAPYVWEAAGHPDDMPVSDAPPWVLERLERPKNSGVFQPHECSVDPRSFAYGRAFLAAGLLGPERAPGRFAVLCPNRAAHTTGRDFDGSTVLFAPGPGQRHGWFKCSHSHCEGLR